MKKIISGIAIACAVLIVYNCTGEGNYKEMIVKKWQWNTYSDKSIDQKLIDLKQAIDTTKDTILLADFRYSLKNINKELENVKSASQRWFEEVCNLKYL